jgi:hypothetical protein
MSIDIQLYFDILIFLFIFIIQKLSTVIVVHIKTHPLINVDSILFVAI